MSSIKFSVIIPVYNREKFIHKAIYSLINQPYRNIEVLVVNDGSTDETESIIQKFTDDRIKYFYKENEERAAARNYGIKKATGDYITFLDSDDIIYNNYFNNAVKVITTIGNPEFFNLGYEIKSTTGRVLYKINKAYKNPNKELMKGNFLSCIGVFVRKDIIKSNLFNEDRNLSGTEDWELWMRIAAKCRLYTFPRISAAMMQHELRSVNNFSKEKLITRIDLAIKSIFEDKHVNEKYGIYRSTIEAYMGLYVALHLIMGREKSLGLKYLFKSIKKSPEILVSYKFYAAIFNFLK